MKPILCFFLLTLLSTRVFAQVEEVVVPKEQVLQEQNQSEAAYVTVEEMPVFNYKNGKSTHESLLNYMNDSIKVPPSECLGKIYIQVVIEADGSVKEVTFLRGLNNCEDYKKVIKRIFTSMPKWRPGKNNGKSARVMFTIPIDIHPN